MTFLDRLTEVHGRLSDLKAVWFPFVFLQPQPHELITPGRRLAMTACFGCYTGLVWMGLRYFNGEFPTAREWGVSMLKACAFFAIWFRLVTVPLWNRRVRRLSSDGLGHQE